MRLLRRVIAVLLVLFPASRVAPQPSHEQTPKHFTNSIGMKFVWIPPGSFLLGSPRDEVGRCANETQHKVTFTKGFYMAAHLVTQEQWRAVMGNNPSYHRGKGKLPVENVSWYDCQEFLHKMRKKDGQPYRLPSEAEWEYACRAGTTTRFHFGETVSTDQANFDGTIEAFDEPKKGVFRGQTTPVGSFPPNAWGLFDMHGNLWQWCADLYVGDYSPKPVIAPDAPLQSVMHELTDRLNSPIYAERQAATKALKDFGQHALPALRKAAVHAPDLETQRRAGQLVAALSEKPESRVLRGSSFFAQATSIRSAYRYHYVVSIRDRNIGFRAVTDATKKVVVSE
jgi:formylglycine-generating enzyme required for sulfatase activity